MDTLLRWGIENSSPEDLREHATASRAPLDPGLIDAILGKPDAVVMQAALEAALDAARPLEARVTALDDLELLVEHIDNANNLTPLQMWAPLLSLLAPPDAPPELLAAALWVLGTAVQNNASAQSALLAHAPLPTLLRLAAHPDAAVRGKALYALSGSTRHSGAGVSALSAAGGWAVLRALLGDSAPPVRRKAAFLCITLLLPADGGGDAHVAVLNTTAPAAVAGMAAHGLPGVLLAATEDADEDTAESAARALAMYVGDGGAWGPDDVAAARAFVTRRAAALDADEWEALRGSLQ